MNRPGRARRARLPAVPASAYVVADAGTGQVLAAKDPHGLLRPASTLKMLTAVTLVPLLNPDATGGGVLSRPPTSHRTSPGWCAASRTGWPTCSARCC